MITYKLNYIILTFLLVSFSVSLAQAKEIEIYAGEDIKYNDNIFNSNTNKKADVISTTSVKALLSRQRLRYVLNFDVGLDYLASIGDTEIDNLNGIANLYYKYDLDKKTDFVFINNFADVKQEARIEAMGVYSGRQRYLDNTTSCLAHRTFGEKLTYGLGYTYEVFDSKEPSLVDNKRNEAATSLSYTLTDYGTDKDSLMATYNYLYRSYKDLGAARLHLVTLGMEKVVTKRLKVTPSVIIQSGEDINQQSFSDVGFGLTSLYLLNPITTIALILEDKNDASALVSNVYKYKKGIFSIVRRLNEKTTVNASFLYGDVDYRDTSTKDKLYKYSLDLSHNINKDFDVGISYAYECIDSNVPDNEYRKNVVDLRAMYRF